MVAITQTSIVGKQKRRITTREGARLQGLPDWYDFVDQADSLTYKQLGNGVNVGAVYNVLKAQVLRDIDLLQGKPRLVKSILGAPHNPDEVLASHRIYFSKSNSRKTEMPQGASLKVVG
jgi:DNA (cytosine-5)-methyltransferase 1